MKKQKFNNKLSLKKSVISGFEAEKVMGGDDGGPVNSMRCSADCTLNCTVCCETEECWTTDPNTACEWCL